MLKLWICREPHIMKYVFEAMLENTSNLHSSSHQDELAAGQRFHSALCSRRPCHWSSLFHCQLMCATHLSNPTKHTHTHNCDFVSWRTIWLSQRWLESKLSDDAKPNKAEVKWNKSLCSSMKRLEITNNRCKRACCFARWYNDDNNKLQMAQ